MEAARRSLGKTGLRVSPIGFGAFKIGRNEKIKYPQPYDLPSQTEVDRLVKGLLDLGVNLVDTAPAYGLSEERIGSALGSRRDDVVLSTKVGETFADGESTYDFSRESVTASVERSLRRLRTDHLDLILIHAHAEDVAILQETEVVATLVDLKQAGKARFIGFSGKTPVAAELALNWADVLMVEYHLDDASHAAVMGTAHEQGIGVLVKKGLASGMLPADQAIRFVLKQPAVSSIVVGGLNLTHFATNLQAALEVPGPGVTGTGTR